MKIILSILICLLLAFSVKAQFSYNDDGQIIPYSMTEKYKSLIDTSKINSCKLKSYNNDSLYNALNKPDQSSYEIVGIPIDTLINLKSEATKYKIDEGTVWMYKIESKTAEQLYMTIKQLEILEGAYICLFPKEKELKIMGRQVFQRKDINTTKFLKYIYGNQMFIEYFEPDKVDRKANIIISRIEYIFDSPFKKKVKTEENIDNTNGHLKSGSHGNATNPCQYNVACTEVSGWDKESLSIVYIFASTEALDGYRIRTKGTGFFINKSTGYNTGDRPYLISAGHVFAPWVKVNDVWQIFDLTNDIFATFEFWVNYKALTCEDSEVRTGQKLPGNFSFIATGSSYNKESDEHYEDPTFEENEGLCYLTIKQHDYF